MARTFNHWVRASFCLVVVQGLVTPVISRQWLRGVRASRMNTLLHKAVKPLGISAIAT